MMVDFLSDAGPHRALAPGALPRLIPAAAVPDPGLAGHLARLGPPAHSPGATSQEQARAIIAEAEAAGLTGRGGAAFPVHRKLSAVAGAPGPGTGRRAVAVANGAEGEPASGKDRSLLWLAPHLVLDGLQLAAAAVGASRAVLYVHRDETLAAHLAAALGQRAAAGCDPRPAELIQAPDRFLAGETSAVISRISGGAARPRFGVPPPYERGVGGQPTLVQNVETLAHLALIGRFGASWFRGAGLPGEPGSMLCTVLRPDGGSYVTEAAVGTPLAALLPGLRPAAPYEPGQHEAGQHEPGQHEPGPGDTGIQAVLVGGYHGTWLDPARAAALGLSRSSLGPAGAGPGAGVLAGLPASRCGLAETARVARYLALESAGQCGPCFNGLPRIAAALAELAAPRPAPAAEADLRRWAGLVAGRGACHHPDGFVRFVGSALGVFAGETARHARGQCRATDRSPFLPVPAPPATEADWS
jgi:NADH:ubiquinone oxidoreductase subunit F (NADH-binding)